MRLPSRFKGGRSYGLLFRTSAWSQRPHTCMSMLSGGMKGKQARVRVRRYPEGQANATPSPQSETGQNC
jgi:hypothetical protein